MRGRYTFGKKYLHTSCKLGVAMLQGEKYYFLSDGYTRWLITDMNVETQEVTVKIWA